MMTKPLELVSKRFNRLLVLSRYPKNTSAGKSQWLVRCDCGEERVVVGSSLISGLTQSCGCYNREVLKNNYIDLSDKIFGQLTVIKESETNHTYGVWWDCKCSCGKEISVLSTHLRKGRRTSCGCSKDNPRIKKEVGKQYNKWSVLKRLNTKHGRAMFLCQCDCGNYSEVSGQNLRSGKSSQCRECGDNNNKTTTHGLSGTPEYARWTAIKRHERKKILDTSWTLDMSLAVLEFFGSCVLCGSTENLEIDHLEPLSLGYGLFVDNVVVLCDSCNSSKSNKYLTDLKPKIRRKLIDDSCAFQDYWDMQQYQELGL